MSVFLFDLGVNACPQDIPQALRAHLTLNRIIKTVAYMNAIYCSFTTERPNSCVLLSITQMI